MSDRYYQRIVVDSKPHTCKLCEKKVTDNRRENGWCCYDCYWEYERFLENVPQYWNDLIGKKGMKPTYEEWREEQYIQKRLDSKKITPEAAKKEAEELAVIIMEQYQPWLFSNHIATPPKAEPPGILSTVRLNKLPGLNRVT